MPSNAQKKARNKWDAANTTIIACKVRKDKADAFRAACKAAGTTPNAMLLQTVNAMLQETSAQAFPTVLGVATGEISVREILAAQSLEEARTAAAAAGETITAFLERAIRTQAQIDRERKSLNQSRPEKVAKPKSTGESR